MSDPAVKESNASTPATNGAAPPRPRARLRVSVDKLRQSRQRSIIGMPELIGLALSALLLLAAVLSYFFLLKPARTHLETLGMQRTQLQRALRASQEGVQSGADKQTTITNILESLDSFESGRLMSRSAGRMVLYNELNALLRRNNVRNTEGPNYVALEALGTNTSGSTTTNPTNAKLQSIFPGIGVNVTVEGPYPNLRHFIRDIESSNQFLIINSIELERVTDSSVASAAPPLNVGSTSGSVTQAQTARASLVSLRLQMSTYFRREGSATSSETSTATSETR